MTGFPFQPIHKEIKRETSAEVDDSPNIFNARDINIHERELVAIQRTLVGDGIGAGNGLLGLYISVLEQLRSISNGGLVSQASGVILSGETVPVPAGIANTNTSGTLLAADTTINVGSTTGFPTQGKLTKFNAVKATTSGNIKVYSFGKNILNYEVVSYTGLTATSFTGCVRVVEGLAQDVTGTDAALIVAGRASVMLGHQLWVENDGTQPIQFYIEHDAALKVTANLFDNQVTLTPADKVMEIEYALLVSGYFDDLRISATGA